MKMPQDFNCDGCGAARGQSGDWRLLRVYAAAQAKTYLRVGSLAIYGWDEKTASRAGVFHACGRSCVHNLVERYLDGTLQADKEAEGATT